MLMFSNVPLPPLIMLYIPLRLMSPCGINSTANTIGIQIAAMGVGGATIPSICGIIAKRFSLEAIPVFMIILIIVLIFSNMYSVRGIKQSAS